VNKHPAPYRPTRYSSFRRSPPSGFQVVFLLYPCAMAEKEDITPMMDTREALIQEGSRISKHLQEVCVERVIQLSLNDTPVGTMVASPAQLRELGAGFVVSEGLAGDVESVVVEGNQVRVYTRTIYPPRNMLTGSSGGISAERIMQRVSSKLEIDRGDIFMVISGIVSELWEKTGGAHCSVIFSGKTMVAKSSDVGRHNTVDKVIGHCILNKIDLSGCVLGCTGRQPAGMVSKALNAGIPIIVSKAATTDEGIGLAEAAGVTLVCRVREDRFCVYTHPERIRGLEADDSLRP